MTEQDDGQAKAANKPDTKSKQRELIRIGITDLLWFALDLYFLAPVSHTAALWVGVLFVAAQLAFSELVESTTRRWGTVIIILLAGAIAQPFLPPNETEFHGWLTPGKETSPPLADSCTLVPVGAWRVYAGLSSVFLQEGTRIVIVSTGDAPPFTPLLWVDKTEKGIAITGDVSDENGTVVRLERNEFTRSEFNSFRISRPDQHSLTVYNRFDEPILIVKFLNPSAIYVTGSLWYRNGGAVKITDDYFTCGRGNTRISEMCTVDGQFVCNF